MRVLGVEGTAWAASAAVYDTETDELRIESDAYAPESGGIHPREAAEHMASAIPTVVTAILDEITPARPDVIAFSQGPGLGPCLRVVGTAARTLAQRFDVPLVGVNHMLAHLEIGRHESGFDTPVCLNASGANAHVLGYRDGRYRILGETMDTGVGNAIDKFARHVGWPHPGGPKVEARAQTGAYVELPYVVKGMDFSFAGITSAAIEAYDEGTPVADVCCGLQETIFSMLTEVSERALSLTGRDELVLGGGVGQNDRLQEMLEIMCAERGASFHVPEDRLLRDNAGMIAVLGAKMARAGTTVDVADSRVRPDFRPDEVPVTWHEPSPPASVETDSGLERGAEAVVERDGARVRKTRHAKRYRHETLDGRLRRERTAAEARLTSLARREGVPTPVITDLDLQASRITFEHVGDTDLRDALTGERAHKVGAFLARLHRAGIVHGDPTCRNVRVDTSDDRLHLIDFGLGFHSRHVEDLAMDLHVFQASVAGTVDDATVMLRAVETGYLENGDADVLERLREIETRGRYQEA